ncbi:MAG: hypothetical protein ACOC0J_01285 [Myxococcota bacterium]
MDPTSLDLNAEEGYLLSRIDGMTTVGALSLLTGFSHEKVGEILRKLESLGLLDAPGGQAAGESGPAEDTKSDATHEPSPFGDEAEKEAGPADTSCDQTAADGEWENEEESAGAIAGGEESEIQSSTHRRLYTESFKQMAVDARVARAGEEEGELLAALCFDPDPRVIRAVLENAQTGTVHARLIAAHHRTGTGLTHLGARAALVRDRQTQRLLFRNPQLPNSLFDKLMHPKRMADAYRLAISRDVTERVKSSARRSFRKKFASGTAEERVSLILTTEGRCLALLIGVPLDGRAASLLAGRPMHSTLLIQNLARWPATPPAVLVHLARQSVVRRTPSLRDMLVRHPNAPSQLKRGAVR